MPSLSSIKQTIQQKRDDFALSRMGSPLKMSFFDSIHFVPSVWDELVGEQHVYLNTAYLKAIEDGMDSALSFRYILFYDGKKAVAAASFQVLDIDAGTVDFGEESMREKVGSKLIGKLGLRCLINGTLFGSGETSFFYKDIEPEIAFQALAIGTQRLYRAEKIHGKVDLILAKDYFPSSIPNADTLKKFNYRGFKIEPNMVLFLKEEWQTLNDYLKAMTSKYRSRAKSVYKKSKNLVERDLNAEEILAYTPRLRELFEAVHDKAGFKMGLLDVAVFQQLKANLGDQFVLKSYFLEDKLVGFSSIFIQNNMLDANYVGLDYEHNKTHSIYLRALYDLVKLGIDRKVERVNFGRTAGEIKSNLGATAVDMKCYIRHRNSVSNKVIKPFVLQITTPEFTERNPFKS